MRVNMNLDAGDPDAKASIGAVKAAIEVLKKGGEWTHYSRRRRAKPRDSFLKAVVEQYERFVGSLRR